MRSLRRFSMTCRAWLLPLLLIPFLGTSLVSCVPPCEAVAVPTIIPTLWVSGGQMYLYSYGARTLYALRASDGAPLWHQNLASAAGLAYADGALYTGYAGDNLTSGCIATGFATAAQLRLADGKQAWHFQAG